MRMLNALAWLIVIAGVALLIHHLVGQARDGRASGWSAIAGGIFLGYGTLLMAITHVGLKVNRVAKQIKKLPFAADKSTSETRENPPA